MSWQDKVRDSKKSSLRPHTHPSPGISPSRRRLMSVQTSKVNLVSRPLTAGRPPESHTTKTGDIQQRGYYSDLINPCATDIIGNVMTGSKRLSKDMVEKSLLTNNSPSVTTFRGPNHEEFEATIKRQKMGPSSKLQAKTEFPTSAWKPKVQTPFYVPPGNLPRKVEIERGKRRYAKQDLLQLLAMENIDSSKLIPKKDQNMKNERIILNKNPDPAPFPPFLPLHIFDNTEYDPRTAEEWLASGHENGVQKPLPGKALLSVLSEKEAAYCDAEYEWQEVGILDYDKKNSLWLVHKVEDLSKVFDKHGKYHNTTGAQHWIPRIRLLFHAECAINFAKRVATAYKLRKKTEGLLRYNLYVDCMPIHHIDPMDSRIYSNMRNRAVSTPGINPEEEMMANCLEVLKRQIDLEYMRTMNKIMFDKAIRSNRKQFAYVTLPEEPKPFPYSPSRAPIMVEYDFRENRDCFAFNSLFTRVEVIKACGNSHAECNKVKQMSLFNTTLTKSMRLEEFEQTQSHAYTQVQLYLRDSWISTLSSTVRSCFQFSGKGWFNMYETSWEMYSLSKLKKLMEMIKFCMQDTIRYLVLDSLHNYDQMIQDACYQVVGVPSDLEWESDLLTSLYKPKRYPLFMVDLVMDETGVHFSTPLDKFPESVIDLFNKAIASTQNVPNLEQFVLLQLFWRDAALLESVGAREPWVCELRAKIKHAIEQSTAPLRAYAKCYEEFLPIHSITVKEYIRTTVTPDKTAINMKDMVNFNTAEKLRVEKRIPSNIVIGAFWINTENVRQALSKKYKELAGAILDHLAMKLRSQSEAACEDCRKFSRKLNDKPATIEDLNEMRDWMASIPMHLSVQQETVAAAMVDYKIIEEFYYNLSQEDFNSKWGAIGWPKKIENQMEVTYEELEKQEAVFRQLQVQNQSAFAEELDSLTMSLAGFASHSDIARAMEISNEVRRLTKQLKEASENAMLYNNRERLFGMPITNYERLTKMTKEFGPYKDLWTSTADWLRWHNSWMNDPLTTIDAESCEKNVNECYRTLHKCIKLFKDIPSVQDVANEVKRQVEEFKPSIPLLQGLRNPGMRIRHWDALAAELGFSVQPKAGLTFRKCLDMNLSDHVEAISKVSETAGKEYAIENSLDKMEREWDNILFEVSPYKDSGTYIIRVPEECTQMLDDHIVMTQTMSFSPYKKPFEERIMSWEGKLRLTQDVLDEWITCQRSWMYLEPIFSSDDISRQLPVEGKRYQTMERIWRKCMDAANNNNYVLQVCADGRLLDKLKECNKLLEQVQKGLSEYLETKRAAFPRFYFLSDDELLEILSQTKDPNAVQPHLKKCFENIYKIRFAEDMRMVTMISGENEEVAFSEVIYPTGNVEDWLSEVERVMGKSVKQQCTLSVVDYAQTLRTKWVLKWPGQVIIAVAQIYWSKLVEEAIEEQALPALHRRLIGMLEDLVYLVRGKLTPLEREMMSALIVIEVHARDVVGVLAECDIGGTNDFEWISQLRYYWEENTVFVRAVNAEFEYGYEYLGTSGRLVVTPLTDRCYLTLTGALHLKFGGAPAGPAGTGKTETTKDLGKALAIQTVVFNCSDQLDYMAMGKFFKGLASSGAWACFDEFNRIDIEVLSVVAQQVATIRNAQIARAERFMFEGVEIALKLSCAAFITMNPGYAGRTELPDNLKALFRPVAMMVPDYGMIAEISLYSFGFSDAKVLSKKITSTFKLSSEQLSSQDHYDFGMRAVKTVICAAGNLKREHPTMSEELICLRAIRDVNVPKFLIDDLKLFKGIVSDLFPRIKEQPIEYGSLLESIKETCGKLNCQDVDGFVHKCIQLYETTVVRHGLMLVGPTCSGKTKCYNVLGRALTALKGQPSISGGLYQTIHPFVLNPKSITMGQLYGEFDLLTHEWTDGILSTLIRQGCNATDTDRRWFMFDGPVDAIWIENMNTVLDDNKKLCLSSGEIIKLSNTMTMMFEVADLAVASPATVSRCGMVYLEPGYIGLAPFVHCWLKRAPHVILPHVPRLQSLFDRYLQPCVDFIRGKVKEIVPSVNGNLTFSMLNLLDCFFSPLSPIEAQRRRSSQSSAQKKKAPDAPASILTVEQHNALAHLVEPWFFFALIWSVGATTDNQGREKFSEYLRGLMREDDEVELPFPEEGMVYDYELDTGYLFKKPPEDEEEPDNTIRWKPWMEGIEPYLYKPGQPFSDIMVPTIDTVRTSFLIGFLIENKKQILVSGSTGTGKTVVVSEKLLRGLPAAYIIYFMMFSAKTGANQTQDMIDGKLDKRRKGIFAPPLGKYAVFFIDDFNMPALEEYGAQPPIEILRQWMDHEGWYDRKAIGLFRTLVDISFICSMGPPGGGRNPITPRMMRHFNYISCLDMSSESKARIFSSIIDGWLEGVAEDISGLCQSLVMATIEVYNEITSTLLPTPAKSHYTFNLRDLAKVFQGMLMFDSEAISCREDLVRLWFHESCRIFQDRLVSKEDRDWFSDQLNLKITDEFGLDLDVVIPQKPILYGDFITGMDGNAYRYIQEHTELAKSLEDYLEDYNQINTARMSLVLFLDAMCHVCRISRIIRQPLGNALLLGVGGSGRQSLSRLATHMADYELFQIELTKSYGTTEWREDIKTCMLKAGLHNLSVCFLFNDTQIKAESFLEDMNNILNSGDVPNIYATEDLENIMGEMKPIVLEQGLPAIKSNMFAAYTKRVRSNLHCILCMSPMGEIFRARIRMFPALITCCTIDWFSEWPDQALKSVASRFIQNIPDIDPENEPLVTGLINTCVNLHQSVATYSRRFQAELGRYNYVTPTSYLELLKIFSKLTGTKISELKTNRDRMKVGLDKLLNTASDVTKLQEDLETMRPLLAEAAEETVQTMKDIEVDTEKAKKTQNVVKKQEKEALLMAAKSQAIAADAQRDLDEALPALEAALASLKSLNKGDVTEIRAMSRPPAGVRLVMEAVCIMQDVKPKRVAGEKLGTKVDDYWEPGKALLQDPQKFLDSLFNYDKDNITEEIIEKIQPYIDNDEFQPAAIARVSKACTSICSWARAMHKYHFVSKSVAPKRAALMEAQGELAATKKILNGAKKNLYEVEQGIATLQEKFTQCVNKKEELANKCQLCEDRLVRADKLIGGLSEEKIRWHETVVSLNGIIKNVIGDVLMSSGFVAYLGVFTGEYRQQLMKDWRVVVDEENVPCTDNPTVIATLGNPVKIRNWQIYGLPRDGLSVENGIVVQCTLRWPLFIDPQGQANKWVKSMERDNGVDVVKLSDRDLLRSLENAIRFGKPVVLENILEELDPALEPILLRQTFKQQGAVVIKLGDAIIPYHDDFKMYITTKLPNPHYSPEASVKVSIVNFTLAPSGLQDQLLGRVVAEERPDLEEAKNQLIVSNAKMKQELKDIEDQILYRLSASEGNPVDNVELIEVLQQSKVKAAELTVKMSIAEKTEKDIDVTRSCYIPVAERTQILFFCVSDLANIDPMYQYSLEWFISIFLSSIANAERADTIVHRIANINSYTTFSLYSNVCRSLFERHKLMFAFLLCVRIKLHEGAIDPVEWRWLLAGSTSIPEKIPNPSPEWLSDRSWGDIMMLTDLDKLNTFPTKFNEDLPDYKRIFDSLEPHREPLPEQWDTVLDDFQKMLVLRCLRADMITNCMQDYVARHMGQRFIEPQTKDLGVVFKESTPTTPLIFVLSMGTDPAADLYKFAEEMRFSKKLSAISLGQGQGPRAEVLFKSAMDRGKWVFFQNCHLSPSWMPSLDTLIENIDPEQVHRDFRLWLTSMPSNKFPVSILQNGSKMTMEPPKGIKANLLRAYTSQNDEFLNSCSRVPEFKSLLFSLCLFHGVLLERRKYGALGFNTAYDFMTGDLTMCISQLKMFLDEYTDMPFKCLIYTAGHINYGGRVTDDWDRRCMMHILEGFYNHDCLKTGHEYSRSGVYKQINPESDNNSYIQYIRGLPLNDTPEIFGMHDNANITFAINDSFNTLHSLILLQPKTSSAAGRSSEEIVDELAREILTRVPHPIDVNMVVEKYPVMYEESMNTVLTQEVIRYNTLLRIILASLSDIIKAIKGLVVMSEKLEKMFNSLYINKVPVMWSSKAYPSLQPLASWVLDLIERMAFIHRWIDDGLPPVFWISGFFFPQAFLTGTLQNFARRELIAIDTISFNFKVIKEHFRDITKKPANGCYIRGLYLEGARWDYDKMVLVESRPKELYTEMATMWLIPAGSRVPPKSGIYVSPIYKTLTRAGTLSTTGHSTNYVIAVEVPSDKPQSHWIKRGVAMICSLDY